MMGICLPYDIVFTVWLASNHNRANAAMRRCARGSAARLAPWLEAPTGAKTAKATALLERMLLADLFHQMRRSMYIEALCALFVCQRALIPIFCGHSPSVRLFRVRACPESCGRFKVEDGLVLLVINRIVIYMFFACHHGLSARLVTTHGERRRDY